jgi:hypothetical protein
MVLGATPVTAWKMLWPPLKTLQNGQPFSKVCSTRSLPVKCRLLLACLLLAKCWILLLCDPRCRKERKVGWGWKINVHRREGDGFFPIIFRSWYFKMKFLLDHIRIMNGFHGCAPHFEIVKIWYYIDRFWWMFFILLKLVLLCWL